MQRGAWMLKIAPNFRSRLKVLRQFSRTKTFVWLRSVLQSLKPTQLALTMPHSGDYRFLYWTGDPAVAEAVRQGRPPAAPKTGTLMPLEVGGGPA